MSRLYACQFRDLSPTASREAVQQLLKDRCFHYFAELSDIWVLLGENSPVLAWAWIVPWGDFTYAIRMIDTFERGHDYAARLIEEIRNETGADLLPHDVVPSAEVYWIKKGYPKSCWVTGPRAHYSVSFCSSSCGLKNLTP